MKSRAYVILLKAYDTEKFWTNFPIFPSFCGGEKSRKFGGFLRENWKIGGGFFDFSHILKNPSEFARLKKGLCVWKQREIKFFLFRFSQFFSLGKGESEKTFASLRSPPYFRGNRFETWKTLSFGTKKNHFRAASVLIRALWCAYGGNRYISRINFPIILESFRLWWHGIFRISPIYTKVLDVIYTKGYPGQNPSQGAKLTIYNNPLPAQRPC